MLNNKGFTIAEVLVSFSLITIILLSIIGSTVFYRDKLKEEEVKSQLTDFKNGITKILYDDIVKGKINHVETCLEVSNCLSLTGVDENGNGIIHTLRIIEVSTSTSEQKRGAYLTYDGDKYFLPDSDLAEVDNNGNIIRECDFTNGLRYSYYNDLFTIKITYEHKAYNQKYDIMVSVIGGKNEYSDNVPRPSIVMINNSVNLYYQGNVFENPYVYNGDGDVSCTSSDTTKVTCKVNKKSKKVIVKAIEVTSSPVTITVDANQISSHFESPSTSFKVIVNKILPTITIDNSAISLKYGGGNGEKSYTYNGNGVVSCSSSNSSKVTCSVDSSNKKVIVSPLDTGSSTITLSATETDHYSSPVSVSFTVNVSKKTPSFSVNNSVVNLTYGGSNGSKNYTYTGDGTVSCSSSDTSKVTCSVDNSNNKIVVTPIAATTSDITITVSAAETASYYAPDNVKFTVSVAKVNCAPPTNIAISTAGKVTWTNSSNCSGAQHQISIDGTNFTNASSGVDYKSTIIGTTGTRIVYVRAVAPNGNYITSGSGTGTKNVYSVTLNKGSCSSVSGDGNYIDGSTTNISASYSGKYYWINWTGSSTLSAVSNSITVNGNKSYTANCGDGCGPGNTKESVISTGGCHPTNCNREQTYIIVSKKVSYTCDGTRRTRTIACASNQRCWHNASDYLGYSCDDRCDGECRYVRDATEGRCGSSNNPYGYGNYCWCFSTW